MEVLSSQGKASFQIGQDGTENIREVDTEEISDFPDDRLKLPEGEVVCFYNSEIHENYSQKSKCTLPLVRTVQKMKDDMEDLIFMW